MIGPPAIAACVVLIAALLLPVRRSASARPIATFCVAAAVWSTGVAWSEASADVNPPANGLILAGVSCAAASAFVAARRLVSGRWRVPVPLLLLLVAEPIAIVIVRTVIHPELTSDQFRATWPFAAHAAYCFGLLFGVILTLNVRQRDPSRRVRAFVFASQALVITIIAMEVAGSEQTHYVVGLAALFAAWVARHPDDWNTSRARADSLLNSIGVFLFVFDRDGRLKDWNGPADRLVELVTGRRPDHDLTAVRILGTRLPFEDGQRVDLELQGGRMRTSAHIHEVDPRSLTDRRDWVVMLRPVRSSVDQTSFPKLSGGLAGHDPTTQTLNRRGTIELLRVAAETGGTALRIEITPHPSARHDETMFVLARRLETMFPEATWGRLSTWVLVAGFEADGAARASPGDVIESAISLGLAVSVSARFVQPEPNEDPRDLVRRVERIQDVHVDTDS